MSAVVVNHLHLAIPVDELAPLVEREFGPVFRAQPGFERFQLVKAGDDHAIVIIEWTDADAAAAGAAVIGPTLFAEHLIPVLAAPQERSVGPAIVTIEGRDPRDDGPLGKRGD
jgi:hypothetical protein